MIGLHRLMREWTSSLRKGIQKHNCPNSLKHSYDLFMAGNKLLACCFLQEPWSPFHPLFPTLRWPFCAPGALFQEGSACLDPGGSQRILCGCGCGMCSPGRRQAQAEKRAEQRLVKVWYGLVRSCESGTFFSGNWMQRKSAGNSYGKTM